MNRKQAIERFLDDFLCFELPPLSEEVLTAVREIKQKGFEVENKSHYINKRNEAISKKYVFAAMLALLVVSVPIIVVMTNQKPVSELPNVSILPDSSEAVSAGESQTATSTEGSETALEHIKLKQINGKVALSGKSEEELEMLLVTYSENNNVYEDDRNIYNFDSQGRLIEMRKADLGDEEGQSVDEQAIAARVNALLKEYYPDWSENECDIRIGKNEDSRPAWTAEVIKTKSDLTEVIYITFERTGELSRIVKLDSNENVGIISKDEASGKTEEKSHPAEKTDSSENKSSEPASQTAKKTDSSANEPSANPSQSGEQSRPAEKTDSSENKSSEPASQTDKKADGHANEQSDPHSRSKEPVTAVATKVSSEVAKKLGNSRSYIEDVINEDFGGLTQEQFDRIAIYKSAHEGRHPYSEAVEAGIVDPDAPKMTLEKMKEIISKANESVTGGRRFNYILYEAKKIQLYYDITADSITEYYYVLSADGDGKEKEAIKITVDYPYGVIQYIRTDEKGEDGKNKKEILFDSEKDDVE